MTPRTSHSLHGVAASHWLRTCASTSPNCSQTSMCRSASSFTDIPSTPTVCPKWRGSCERVAAVLAQQPVESHTGRMVVDLTDMIGKRLLVRVTYLSPSGQAEEKVE